LTAAGGAAFKQSGCPGARDTLPAGVRVTFRVGGMGHSVMLKTVHPESHVYSRAEFSMQERASDRDQSAVI